MNMSANSSQIFFAAHAPTEIPAWFEHQAPGDCPELPDPYQLPEKVRQLAVDWVQEHCFDLQCDGSFEDAEILAQFEKDWSAAFAARETWRKRNERARYFQWRLYYAEQMANSFETLGMFAEAFSR